MLDSRFVPLLRTVVESFLSKACTESNPCYGDAPSRLVHRPSRSGFVPLIPTSITYHLPPTEKPGLFNRTKIYPLTTQPFTPFRTSSTLWIL